MQGCTGKAGSGTVATVSWQDDLLLPHTQDPQAGLCRHSQQALISSQQLCN